MLKLNLGCGSWTPEGWINVDYAWGAKFSKLPFFYEINKRLRLFNSNWDKRTVIHDLRKKFPWQSDSVDIIYSSHTIEHFLREEGFHFLKECYRVLKLNGIVRIVTPNLLSIISEYNSNIIRADELLRRHGVLYEGISQNKVKRVLTPFVHFPHRCMYDSRTLLSILEDIGFPAEPKKTCESAIPGIMEIENTDRKEVDLIVEGVK